MSQRYVLFLFGNNEVAYSGAASLDGSRCRPIIFSPKGNNILNLSSKFHLKRQSRFAWPEAGYLEELLSFLKPLKEEGRVLTFLCNDEAVYFWIKNQPVLEEHCSVLAHSLERFYNKFQFYKALAEIEMPFPKTWSLADDTQPRFPFIVKPALRDYVGPREFPGKILVVNNKWDLGRVKRLDPQKFLAQEMLDFTAGEEYSWWGYRNLKGEVTSVVVKHRGRFPLRYGRVTHLEIVQHQLIKPMGDAVVQQLRYSGLAEIQIVLDRNAQMLKVVDINPRLWCGHSLMAMSDSNLIRQCADEYYGLDQSRPARREYDVESGQRYQWFSVLDNFYQFNLSKIRCSEFYRLSSDNLVMQLAGRVFLFLKFFYYLTLGRFLKI